MRRCDGATHYFPHILLGRRCQCGYQTITEIHVKTREGFESTISEGGR